MRCNCRDVDGLAWSDPFHGLALSSPDVTRQRSEDRELRVELKLFFSKRVRLHIPVPHLVQGHGQVAKFNSIVFANLFKIKWF